MTTLIDNLNSFADGWLTRAGTVAWQWALLAFLVAVPLAWALRGHAPALRYWVWQIVLLKLLVMPFWAWTVPLAWLPAEPTTPIGPDAIQQPAPPLPAIGARPQVGPPASESAAEADSPPSAPLIVSNQPTPSISWRAWLVLAWTCVILLQIGRLCLQRRRLDRLLRDARPVDRALADAMHSAATTLGLRQPPCALLTDRDCSPFVCGIWSPTLVVPAALGTSLTPAQLQQVLLHELAHIRRRDLAWGWIPEIARLLWWFHPVVHWAVFRLRLERELACDQLALAHSGQNAAEYAETLVQVVGQRSFSVATAKRGVNARG